MSKSVSELNKENADYYGYEAQSSQLIEECAELIQAVSKFRRAETEKMEEIALANYIEEIADVELMLGQIKYLLQIPEDELEAVKLFKVNRTRERIQNSN